MTLEKKDKLFLPTKTIKGKSFKTYKGTKVPTKAELLRRALKKVKRLETHENWIDFIPATFTLQVHGWFDKNSYKDLADVVRRVKMALRAHKDPIIYLPYGKFHYDIRILKVGSPTWFGFTLFRFPSSAISEDKALGTVKGYQSIVPGGKALQKFLKEKADSIITSEGVSERRDKVEWLKVKAKWFKPFTLGTPTSQPGIMVAIELLQPAVIHRRELDFLDITFLGKYLNGRYFYRMVERLIPKTELTKEKQKLNKNFYKLQFYFWRSKKHFGPDKMLKVANNKLKLDPIAVAEQGDYTLLQKPCAKWAFKRGGKIIN